MALTRQNPIRRLDSRLGSSPTLRGPREWVGLRKKCPIRPNDYTNYNVVLQI